ncbi:MAG TPA: acyltransferase [Candidatus Angelobacter sp.]
MKISAEQALQVVEKSEKRVAGIDILRGLCIIAVVLHHINIRIHFRDSSLGHWMGPAANRVFFWSGYYGVRVFFVISGFLITGWSLQRWGSLRQLNIRQFYRMRFARIVPCLLGLLLILAVLDRAGASQFTINTQHTSLGRALIAALSLHMNWLEARTGYLPASWDVLWSLSVEEVFYVFFPLVCLLLRKPALIIGLLSCFLVIGPFARVHTHNELWADYGYFSCMDGIAFGCLAALATARIKFGNKGNLTFRCGGTLLCLLIVVFRGIAARLALYKAGLDVTVLEIGTALLLIAIQQTFEHKKARASSSIQASAASRKLFTIRTTFFRSTAFLRWFGRNSYEVYLTHMFVVWPMVMLFRHFHQSINAAPLWFLAATALAGFLGYAVARFYSEPLNHLLRMKFMPKKPAAASLSAAAE